MSTRQSDLTDSPAEAETATTEVETTIRLGPPEEAATPARIDAPPAPSAPAAAPSAPAAAPRPRVAPPRRRRQGDGVPERPARQLLGAPGRRQTPRPAGPGTRALALALAVTGFLLLLLAAVALSGVGPLAA
jgi:hypothetical protein